MFHVPPRCCLRCASVILLLASRSLADSIDLVTAGTGTYSPVNLPAAPVQQLGGDAKVRLLNGSGAVLMPLFSRVDTFLEYLSSKRLSTDYCRGDGVVAALYG